MTPRPKPRVYLLHGADGLARGRGLAKLRQGLGASDPAALDYIPLKGENLTLGRLEEETHAQPFFAQRRLVHVFDPLACPGLKKQKQRQAFLEALTRVPPSCALVLDVPRDLNPNHWLRAWVDAHPDIAFQRAYPLPKDLTRWILARAAEEGGRFTPQAASELARRLDGDAVSALHEIRKLLAYVGYRRAVEVDDVQELTPAQEHPNIFEMVDAIALGNSARGLRLLHQLLAEEEAPRIWGMVVRQFRLLILARTALDQGIADRQRLAKAIGVHPFVAQKLIPQARRFPLTALKTTYARLWAVDRDWKTGQSDLVTAMDLLIASLGR